MNPRQLNPFLRAVDSVGVSIGFPKEFAHSQILRWESGFRSTAIFRKPGQAPALATLKRLEKFFARGKMPASMKQPYFTVLFRSPKDPRYERVTRELAKLGYELSGSIKTYSTWTSPEPLKLPKGYSISVAQDLRGQDWPAFKQLLRRNFQFSTATLREVKYGFERLSETFNIVVIRYRGKPVAGGATYVRGESAFLYGGSVDRAHRGKGLWRALLAGRQWASAGIGAKFWYMRVQNDQIAGKGEAGIWHQQFVKAAGT